MARGSSRALPLRKGNQSSSRGGGAGVSADTALRTARFKADAFIAKPLETEELLAAVQKVLGTAA